MLADHHLLFLSEAFRARGLTALIQSLSDKGAHGVSVQHVLLYCIFPFFIRSVF